MESDAKYLWVGIVTIILIGMLVFAIVWITEIGGMRDVDYYTIYFKEHNLDGLQVDSDVTMKGIKVGSVVDFTISPDDIERVKVYIRLERGTPVKLDTEAVIRRNLLTGLARIDLIGSSKESPYKSEIFAGELYPIIPEGQTELGAITQTIPGLVDKINEMVGRANAFLTDENIQAVNSTFLNLESFASVLGKNSDNFDSIINDLSQLSNEISQVTSRVREFTSKADTRFDTFTSHAQEGLTDLREAITNLDARLQGVTNSLKSAADILAIETSNISRDISTASQALTRTLEKFEDPTTIILGPGKDTLGPGERFSE
jgi:phospholipid/cholesterol/gamma-HCH transport system substrate-binding protein